MTLTAIHKTTGERIVIAADQNLRSDYTEWDQLICPVTGLKVFPVRSYTRQLSGIDVKVRSHFRVQNPLGEPDWPEQVIFDPEYGIKRAEGLYFRGESWEHLEGKNFVAEQLRSILGEQVEIIFEQLVRVGDGSRYRIADVAVRWPSGLMEVHEVQLAPITLEEINQRTEDYASTCVPAQWWIGKSNTDSHAIRDFLRNIHGGFFVLQFAGPENDTLPSGGSAFS